MCERNCRDYFTPFAEVFCDCCENMVRKCSLVNMVEQSQIGSIDLGFSDNIHSHDDGDLGEGLSKIITNCRVIKLAKIIFLLIGAGGRPIISFGL